MAGTALPPVAPDPINSNEKGLVDLRLDDQFQNFVDEYHKNSITATLERVLPAQCSAEVALEFDPLGLHFRMTAPLIEERLVPSY